MDTIDILQGFVSIPIKRHDELVGIEKRLNASSDTLLKVALRYSTGTSMTYYEYFGRDEVIKDLTSRLEMSERKNLEYSEAESKRFRYGRLERFWRALTDQY